MGSKDPDLNDLLSDLKNSHNKKVKKDPAITVTDKGGKTKDLKKYVKDKEVEKFAEDVGEVRTEEIGKYHEIIDKGGLKSKEHRYQKKEPHHLKDFADRTKKASYVKHLTEEDILYEQELEKDQANYKRYGQERDDELLTYVKSTILENSEREKEKKKGKNLISFAVVNATQRGPATIEDLSKRINFVMETHGIGFKVQPIQVKGAIQRLFLKNTELAPNRYLPKYLIVVQKDVKNDTMYGFLTDTMRVPTVKFQAGTYVRLPKGVPNYTEKMLLKEVPSLKDVDLNPLYFGRFNGEDEETKNLWATRIHNVQSHKFQRLTELKEQYIEYANITKYQFLLGLLATKPGEILSATELSDEALKFIRENPNKRKEAFDKMHSNEANAFHKIVRNEDNPCFGLTFQNQKTIRSIEVGSIPELSLIDIKDQWVLLKGGPPGWKLLEDLCSKSEALDCALNPDKYAGDTCAELTPDDPVEEASSEDTPVEELEDEPLNDIDREVETVTLDKEDFIEGLEVKEVVETMGTDPLKTIADALSHIRSNGLEVNFNVSFGRFQPSQNGSRELISVTESLNETNRLIRLLIGKIEVVERKSAEDKSAD
jgi:hypothetical protein